MIKGQDEGRVNTGAGTTAALLASALEHIKRGRNMVPDDDEGLASDIFARAINHAERDLLTALRALG